MGSLPQAAKVGDSGTVATLLSYADSSKQGTPGTIVLSYSVEADGTSSTSAILKLITANSDATGKLQFTHTASYRVGTDSSLTTLGMDDTYANGLHLVYTASPASAQPAKLTVIDTLVGTGATSVAGQTLTVNYTGWLYDPSAPNFKGKQFDTSTGRGPFTFQLGAGAVIAGWDQGMAGMKVGGKRTLLIPSILGYRTTGAGANIPGNAALVFDVELVSVK
jgi:FKBP-type peptidyl-prolyl cis-trans isomerase FkpA